ncbi:hypothetical protein ACLOJK_013273 [Asimina triloba]
MHWKNLLERVSKVGGQDVEEGMEHQKWCASGSGRRRIRRRAGLAGVAVRHERSLCGSHFQPSIRQYRSGGSFPFFGRFSLRETDRQTLKSYRRVILSSGYLIPGLLTMLWRAIDHVLGLGKIKNFGPSRGKEEEGGFGLGRTKGHERDIVLGCTRSSWARSSIRCLVRGRDLLRWLSLDYNPCLPSCRELAIAIDEAHATRIVTCMGHRCAFRTLVWGNGPRSASPNQRAIKSIPLPLHPHDAWIQR